MKDKKKYRGAFKLKVMEELRDGKWKTVADAAQAYGVSDGVRKENRGIGGNRDFRRESVRGESL